MSETDAIEVVSAGSDDAAEQPHSQEAAPAENNPSGSAGQSSVEETIQAGHDPNNLDLIMQIPVSVEVVLGSVNIPVEQLTKLGPGSVIGLERRVGEPVDIVVNGRVIARGEVVLMDDDTSRFGVSLKEVVSSAHPKSKA